jgi:hypothetical protein
MVQVFRLMAAGRLQERDLEEYYRLHRTDSFDGNAGMPEPPKPTEADVARVREQAEAARAAGDDAACAEDLRVADEMEQLMDDDGLLAWSPEPRRVEPSDDVRARAEAEAERVLELYVRSPHFLNSFGNVGSMTTMRCSLVGNDVLQPDAKQRSFITLNMCSAAVVQIHSDNDRVPPAMQKLLESGEYVMTKHGFARADLTPEEVQLGDEWAAAEAALPEDDPRHTTFAEYVRSRMTGEPPRGGDNASGTGDEGEAGPSDGVGEGNRPTPEEAYDEVRHACSAPLVHSIGLQPLHVMSSRFACRLPAYTIAVGLHLAVLCMPSW